MGEPGATFSSAGARCGSGPSSGPGAAVNRRARTVSELLSRRHLRRVELAFAGFNAAEYGVWVAVLVYAYERGGTAVAAAVAVAQLVPAALVAPIASVLSDTHGGAVALRAGYALQAAAVAATALLLLTGAPSMAVYASAIVAASAVTIIRPAQAALLPTLIDGPAQLTAVTVLSGWVESVSVLVGPALSGVLIAVGGPGAAVACFGLCVAVSAVLVAPVPGRRTRETTGERPGHEAMDSLRGGIDALRADSGLAAVVLLLAVRYLVTGVIDVLVIVLAVSVVGMGPHAAGYLTAVFGAGGLLGALATLSLVHRRRLLEPLIGAAVGWGMVLVALGAWPTAVGTFLLLTAAGCARSVLDISGRAMLLRAVPASARGRVFGVLEGVAMLGLAVGSMLVPVLVALDGPELVLVATGSLLSAVALVRISHLRGADRAGQLPAGGRPLLHPARA